MSGKNTKIRLLVSLLVCFMSFSIFPQASAEPTRTTYTVTTTLDSGAGSLRQAINDANSSGGKDYIYFDIPTSALGCDTGAGICQINVSTILPSLDDPNGVVIDGTTQPGYVSGQKPKIVVSGYGLPAPGSIFSISSGSNGNTIRGLSLGGVAADILTINGDNNLIEKNEIRYSSTGNGIKINSSASGNFIYTNFIFGNHLDGIFLNSSSGNTIWRNGIGLLPNYYSPPNDPNDGDGIQCILCTNNEIKENVISANLGSGIYFSAATNNLIQNNFIGLTADGFDDLGNGVHGIRIENNSTENNVFINLISGNTLDGIRLSGEGTTLNHIEKNWIGVGLAGAVPNGNHGIGIYDGAHHNYIGNFTIENRGNLIAANTWSGVVVVNSSTGSNYIYKNNIIANSFYGVHINNSFDNFIGSNFIANNGMLTASPGVLVQGSASISNAITMNSITDNGGLGIRLIEGGNASLAAPVISYANCHTVTGTTCPNCFVQVYSDDLDEGEIFEQFVMANEFGNFTYTDFGYGFRGPNITAIANDADGNYRDRKSVV